MNGIAVRQVV